MALSDWYEVIHEFVSEGESMLNVYHALRADAGRDAGEIVEAFNDSVMPDMANIQYVGVTNVIYTARNLDDPFDFATRVPGDPVGLRPGANFATFNAVTVQFNRQRTDMKNGQKRWYAGVEPDNNGAVWDAAFLTSVGVVATAVLNPWELSGVPGVPVCNFGILQRICVIQPPPTPCVAFRLPKTDAELQFYIPNTAIVRATVRSQVSRKRLS